MKNISLPTKELRLLSLQLQNFQSGYTVEQIRLLDKSVSAMDKVLQPFNSKLNELKDKPCKEGDNKELEDFIEIEGNKEVSCEFEDTDLEFVKSVWSKMSGLSGNDIARKSIISIDDALKGAREPVFK